jgi:hypothetical protein
VKPNLPVVKLRHITTKTGVMIAAPAMALATSGTSVPCRNAILIDFIVAVIPFL